MPTTGQVIASLYNSARIALPNSRRTKPDANRRKRFAVTMYVPRLRFLYSTENVACTVIILECIPSLWDPSSQRGECWYAGEAVLQMGNGGSRRGCYEAAERRKVEDIRATLFS